MRRVAWIALGSAIISWFALYFSSAGVLVGWQKFRPDGAGQDVLRCSYFTGMEVAPIEFWFSENNVFGRAICPRLYHFGN